jgi:histidyl-tRNA synthetase
MPPAPDSSRPGDANSDTAAEAASGLRLVKGTDDRLPEEQIVRDALVATLRRCFERFGFAPAETPILEYFDILASKYAGGAEILRETYTLKDQGERELALRYDLTVPFARLIGMNHQSAIRLPFKRYEIGRVFRDGPVDPGRRREFMQCDVDVVGIRSTRAEAELIALADMVFGELGIAARCDLNHRGLLSALLDAAGVEADAHTDAILSLDKLLKIGRDGVTAEMRQRGLSDASIASIFAAIEVSELPPAELIASFRAAHADQPAVQMALDELATLFRTLDLFGVTLPVRFVPTLARGLTIYTGPVFEFFLQDQSLIGGAIAAGGRYDRIIEDFLVSQGEKPQPTDGPAFPTVGMSFGLEPLSAYLLSTQPSEQRRRTVTQVLVVSMDEDDAAAGLVARLRRAGINAELEMRPVRMKKALAWADSLGVPFVAILGGDEVAAGEVTLKTLAERSQQRLTEAALIETLRAAALISATGTGGA